MFEDAFEALIGNEGRYVNDPKDPGGETKFGISKRSYPNLDIKNLSLEDARKIYKRDFWDKVRGDELPYTVAFQLFDAAVNSGVGQAIEWLQQAVGAVPDGSFGPKTMAAFKALNPVVVAARMEGWRITAMTNMGGWDHFGRGWARRIGKNLIGFA